MAISKNLWLDGAKQKLAGAVTYTLKGQQIIRKEAPQVANPRTTAQMNQRVRLANLVNFYRANIGWMKRGAFENKKQTQSDYNAFVSRNIQTSNIALTKAEALAGAVVAAPYQVTDGSLPELNYNVAVNQLSIPLPGLDASNGSSLGNFTQKLLMAYPALRDGDQLSIIVYVNKRDSSGYPRLQVFPNEVTLDIAEEEGLVSSINVAGHNVTATSVEGVLRIMVAPLEGESISYSMCVSRTTSTGIKVSPSYLRLGGTTFYDGYSSSEQFQKSIDSYGDSSANFLDSTSVAAGDSNTSSGDSSQGGSGAGDPGDVTP